MFHSIDTFIIHQLQYIFIIFRLLHCAVIIAYPERRRYSEINK